MTRENAQLLADELLDAAGAADLLSVAVEARRSAGGAAGDRPVWSWCVRVAMRLGEPAVWDLLGSFARAHGCVVGVHGSEVVVS